MAGTALLFLILGLGLIAWITGRTRAAMFVRDGAGKQRGYVNSLPSYHGWYLALWAVIPAIIFSITWDFISPGLVTNMVLLSPAAADLPAGDFGRAAILSEARAIAQGLQDSAFQAQSEALVPAYKEALSHYRWIGFAVAMALFLVGALFAYTRLKPDLRARTKVERLVMALLLIASLIATITTIGIFASLIFETVRFFQMVSPIEFLFGTSWSPRATVGEGYDNGYGAIPLFWGTIFVGAVIAMIVAIPLGLMSAIYLTQYASARMRSWMKPILEILAGVPTVVYGYFAALTVAPAVRDFAVLIGFSNAASDNALAAGVVMGIMIIPLVSSMADDSIAAVPSAMRDGSLAMGATKSETIKKVLLPAALPGVVGGILLAVSRAIGETMIVVMAAGYTANLTANPFASISTITVQIKALLTGDINFNGPQVLAAFALGLTLFLVTFLLNIMALRVVKKYREAYD
ncbi:phosphate ABC transporter permease subunit PstC [Sphingorhabdus arenilitoris]|uniref:Phosphate transport system permease protein n=1 Tax=Sphingorhabdus arenilitoris TaxID=1490041 RepID=A0ABV8RIR7_9SPHN